MEGGLLAGEVMGWLRCLLGSISRRGYVRFLVRGGRGVGRALSGDVCIDG